MSTADDLELPERDPAIVQAEQLNDAAMSQHKDGRYGLSTAATMLRRALALAPDVSAIWSNLGIVLWRHGDVEGARHALFRALDLSPDSPSVHGNLGVFLSSVYGDSREAEDHLLEAMRLDPTALGPRWDRALLYLRRGEWKAGLAEYEVRIDRQGKRLYPDLPVPTWRGEDLTNKSLYVQGEQGIGDRFLFSRYLWWIHETWPTCKIYCCIFDGLVNVFWEFRRFVEFLPIGVPWPDDLDYGAYLCGLPAIHGSTPTNIPPDPGLLLKRVLRARDDNSLNLPQPKLPSIRVGIAWTGNPEQVRNEERSIPLELMMTLGEDPRLSLYSFQCSPGSDDMRRLGAGDLICDLSKDIEREGWTGTGIAMLEMDVLVTVCTSLAHFAGTLRIPCMTLLCTNSYWIWQTADTTPFYPGMRLIRQRTLNDWLPVIDQVKAELSQLADAKLSK